MEQNMKKEEAGGVPGGGTMDGKRSESDVDNKRAWGRCTAVYLRCPPKKTKLMPTNMKLFAQLNHERLRGGSMGS